MQCFLLFRSVTVTVALPNFHSVLESRLSVDPPSMCVLSKMTVQGRPLSVHGRPRASTRVLSKTNVLTKIIVFTGIIFFWQTISKNKINYLTEIFVFFKNEYQSNEIQIKMFMIFNKTV